ncbi:MAG: hypothetical protein IBX62_05475 [Coriobacteriia bacterium]|nr:hypothetical protein [Coriobacteriia bacterium]
MLVFEAPASGPPDRRAAYEYTLEDDTLTLSPAGGSSTDGAWLTRHEEVVLRRVPPDPLGTGRPLLGALLAFLLVVSTAIAVGVVGWRRRRGYYAAWAAAYLLTIAGLVVALPEGPSYVLSGAAAACLVAGLVDRRWHAKRTVVTHHASGQGVPQVLAATALGAAGLGALFFLQLWGDPSRGFLEHVSWGPMGTGLWFSLVVVVLGAVAFVALRTDNPAMALRAAALLGVLGVYWIEPRVWLVGLPLLLSAGLNAGATWAARTTAGVGTLERGTPERAVTDRPRMVRHT